MTELAYLPNFATRKPQYAHPKPSIPAILLFPTFILSILATCPAAEPDSMSLDCGNGLSIELIKIPAGSFKMGSKESEKWREGNEKLHTVKITKPFYMGKTNVTQEQYEALTGRNPSLDKGATNPVAFISWNETAKYCELLSQKNGKKVQLPTEAQWEYACRAGTTTVFFSGDDEKDLGDYAWYARNSEKKSHPAGTKKPNQFGLYDMLGNIGQWCQDWQDNKYYGVSPKEDPPGPEKGEYKSFQKGECRVIRGGSWDLKAQYCRCAYRSWNLPDFNLLRVGVRVVVPAE